MNVNQIIMLYILNVHNAVCQLYSINLGEERGEEEWSPGNKLLLGIKTSESSESAWDRTEPDLEGPGDEGPKDGLRVCCRDSQRNSLGMDTQLGSVALGHRLEAMIPGWVPWGSGSGGPGHPG